MSLMTQTRRNLITGGLAVAGASLSGVPLSALAQNYQNQQSFSQNELVGSGHKFFGNVSRGLALTIEEAVRRWGEPNGYVLGQEASGAFVGGLRYGEGQLYTRNAGDRRCSGRAVDRVRLRRRGRTMMLVYNLPVVDALYQRFAGVDGSAYFIGGFGFHCADGGRHHDRSDPHRRRLAARRQSRLSQVHAAGDLEPVLTVEPGLAG
jgi:hypothetical protein